MTDHSCTSIAGSLCCCDKCCTKELGCGLCASICTGCLCCPPVCLYVTTCFAGWCGTCCLCCHLGCKLKPETVVGSIAKLYVWCVMGCFPCCIPKDNFAILNDFVYHDKW